MGDRLSIIDIRMVNMRGVTFVSSLNPIELMAVRGRKGQARLTMSNRDGKPNNEHDKKETYCGFAALLGPSNSGKSTLLNHLVGYKVAIVTPKVQTTRCRICGIAAYNEDTQVIFLDTPGVFSAKNRLSRAMVKSAWRSSQDGDAIAIILDGIKLKKSFRSRTRREDMTMKQVVTEDIGQVLKGVSKGRERGRFQNVCVCINKMDVVGNSSKIDSDLNELLSHYKLSNEPKFYISAKTGQSVDAFKDWVVKQMPKGPWLYEEDDMTDMPSRQLAAEVSREKAFMLLNQELPYELAVDTKEFRTLQDGSIRITQDILVARESQKRIVTGRGGSVVKQIGMRARADLSEIFGTTVHLMIVVKVRTNWQDDKWQFQQWGLDFNA